MLILLIHVIVRIVLGISDLLTRTVNVILSYILYITLPIFLLVKYCDNYYILYFAIIFLFLLSVFILFTENRKLRTMLGISDDFIIYDGGVMDLPLYGLIILILILTQHLIGFKDLFIIIFGSFLLLLAYFIHKVIHRDKRIPLFYIYMLFICINFSYIILIKHNYFFML